ncbi:MAG: CoA transferase [Candidatus Tectomicrobia bacterium]|uniref:CoA transferase n=1 Tax=Tectimicrobiota bacterium TaxID=2528274 RepID=A0A932HZD0_UNCTE|nr:CoA transferase [Candidatus Tectomicrobia bacterium]
MPAPLVGIRVLDLTRILAGPYCTMMLGDMGAEIIKVENPDGGDDTRAWGPPFLNGVSTYFISINRNKKSVTLDLKKERGKALLAGLIRASDVVVENFRPGTLDKLGFPWEEIHRLNPRAVFCSVSGFGQTGPRKSEPGFDVVIQGEGGVMSLTGEPDGPPAKVGASVADITAGMLAANGILLALFHRERTGEGQMVDVGMLDGQVALLTYHATGFFATGKVPPRRGNRHPSITPYETYKCRDGYFNLGVGNDSLWRRFCDAMSLTDIKQDPRFAVNANRVGNREALQAILDPFFAARDLQPTLAALRKAGVPCGPINTLDQVFAEPQVLAREMVVEVDVPQAGRTKVTGVPIKLSATPGAVRTPPPSLGQHTDEVLESVLKLDAAARKKLRDEGVV